MLDIDKWLQPVFNSLNSIDFQIVLLIGSGILAISLLFLALTHWGKSRPVWKCVLLSFAAHIILIGYAYGTRMLGPVTSVAEPAVVETSQPLNVSLIDDQQDDRVTNPPAQEPVDAAIATGPRPIQAGQTAPEYELLEPPPLQRAIADTEVVFETQKPIAAATAPDGTSNDFEPTTEFKVPPAPTADPESEVQRFADSQREWDNQLDLLPAGKIVDPEAISIQRHKNENSFVDDLAPAAESQFARLNPVTEPDPLAVANQSVKDSFSLADSFQAAGPASLPAPAAAPEWNSLTKIMPLPRPKNGFQSVKQTRRIADGQPLPSIYSLRSVAARLSTAQQRGGSILTEQAVENALQWLADHQELDGRWNPEKHGAGQEDRVFGHNRNGAGGKADTGITGLATLAFLGSGNTHLNGDYTDSVKRAINFLINKQKSNGDLSGDAKLFAKMYCHSMALFAISESLAITGDKNLLLAVQRGVDYSVAAQNPTDGGWRYQPGDAGDMSQFGWQLLALKSARLGGAIVPDSSFEQMQRFLKNSTSGIGGGLASYRPRQRPSAPMTAEALLCRYFLDQKVADATLFEASRMIMQELPNRNHVNLYYWYYGTLAMYHAGGNDWQRWNTALKETLLPMQETTGPNTGSWPPNGMWGGYGGRVYSTATAALNLEVYYRYLPVYQELARRENVQLDWQRR